MTKRTFFLTLREDILSVMALVERRGHLAYRPVRTYDTPAVPRVRLCWGTPWPRRVQRRLPK